MRVGVWKSNSCSKWAAAYFDTPGPKSLIQAVNKPPYVSHLTENGVDRRFIQVQVGHECDSSTAIYTHVSDDFMNTMLKKALSPAFDPPAPLDKEP